MRLLLILILFLNLNCFGVTIICKVGNASKLDSTNPHFKKSWRDGQIFVIQDDSEYIGTATRKNFAIFRTPENFNSIVLESKNEIDINKKFKGRRKYWRNPFSEGRNRKRDYYINYEKLVADGIITQHQFDDILDKTKSPIIELHSFAILEKYFYYEDDQTKSRNFNSLNRYGTISAAGTYSIGTGKTYADLGAFEADLPADLTSPSVGGEVYGEFQVSEETNTDGVVITFDHITDSSDTLRVGVNDDNVHDGKWNSSKARINYGTSDAISFVGNSGSAIYMTFEKLQLDISGSGNNAFNAQVITPTSGDITINRCIIKGDVDSGVGAYVSVNDSTVFTMRNCVIYDLTKNATYAGWGVYLRFDNSSKDGITKLFNNTFINCYSSVVTSIFNGTHTLQNNIIQDSLSYDILDGSDFNTSEYNIINDSTNIAQAYDGSTVVESGTTDSTSSNKLIQSGQNFQTTVQVGMVIKNTTDTTYTYVTAVDSDTQLSVNDDIFISGEGFSIVNNFFGTLTFEDKASDDFHLDSSDSLALGEGADLSGSFTDDIDGDTRSDWDIGADELIEAVTFKARIIIF